MIFKEDTHQYFTEEGVEIPSVTTILNYVTSEHYGAINPSILERARLRGSAVHETCEMLDYGYEVDEISPEIVPFIKGYMAFLRDYFPKWNGIEQIAYKDYLDYTGTVDRYGVMSGRKVVVDIKTTSSPNKRNYIALCAQTSAYARLLCDTTYEEFDRYGLFLKSDGDYRIVNCREYEEKHGFSGMEIFDECNALYHKLKEIEGGK